MSPDATESIELLERSQELFAFRRVSVDTLTLQLFGINSKESQKGSLLIKSLYNDLMANKENVSEDGPLELVNFVESDLNIKSQGVQDKVSMVRSHFELPNDRSCQT